MVDSFVGGGDELAIWIWTTESTAAKHLQADHMTCRVASFEQTTTVMFARGPRFDLTKGNIIHCTRHNAYYLTVPEVPAPNAYNVQLESALDNYKRGAFLEKADRFSKEKAEAAQGVFCPDPYF